MKLIRWNPTPVAPLHDLTRFEDEVNRLFDGVFTRRAQLGDEQGMFSPAVDIDETPGEFVLRMDLPGVAPKDVKVSLLGDTLTIRGERRQENAAQGVHQHRLERVHGTFERSFTLGTPVGSDKVKAQYRDGVLEVHVPKAEESRTRDIEVQVN
jgi:HSP20 family protein